MRLDTHQHTKTQQQGQHRGAAVAHQRQRYADYRQDAADHAHVDECVGGEGQRDGARHQAREIGRGIRGDDEAAPDHEHIQTQQDQVAEQAEFFRVHRENEVGGALRQEVEMGLCAVQVALAEDAAGTHCDGRLDGMVTLAQRVLRGVEQHQDAMALVVVQHRPQHRRTGERRDKQSAHHAPAQPGQEQHVEAAGGNQQRGAQIGLARDQRDRHQQQQCGNEIIFQRERGLVLFEVPGHHQRHADFHQLGRLDGGDAEIQPAPRAVADLAEQRHADQQRHAEQVNRHGGAHQVMQRQVGDQPHAGQRYRDVDHLAQRTSPACIVRAVQHHQAGQHQQADAEQQRQVKVRDEAQP